MMHSNSKKWIFGLPTLRVSKILPRFPSTLFKRFIISVYTFKIVLFVSKQLQVGISALKFYCPKAPEDFSLVFLREIARPCKRLEILRKKLRGTTLKF